MTWIIISGIVIWLIGTVIFFKTLSGANDSATGLSMLLFGLIFIIVFASCEIYSIIQTQNCSERSQRVVPTFVMASDSSFKVIKYKEFSDIIERTEPMFYTPNEKIVLDTCTNKLEILK